MERSKKSWQLGFFDLELENLKFKKRKPQWVWNLRPTDQQSGLLIITPNGQVVSERHTNTFTILLDWFQLNSSNKMNLIQNRKMR